MFQAVINRAQHSVETTVTKYVLRVIVAVPFIIAFGFGTAAASAKLVQTYGPITGYSYLAAGFAVIGLIAVAIISATDQSSEPPSDRVSTLADDTVGSTIQKSMIDPDFIVAALGIVGPKAIPAIPVLLRFVLRNWALVLTAVLLSYLLFSQQELANKSAVKATGEV